MGVWRGVDISFERPDYAALFTVGTAFVGRYIGPGSGKLLSKAEANVIHALGMSIVLLAEGFGDDALLGFTKGEEHARMALAAANALGVPPDRPIYFAVDFDMQPSQQGQVEAYFLGVDGVIGHNRIGIYGGIRTLQWARANNLALFYYQTAAWSAGQTLPYNHIYQYAFDRFIAGAHMDLDYGYFPDIGQWPIRAKVPVPPSSPPPAPQSAGPWDYTGDINGLADDILTNARTGQSWATLISQLPR